MDSLVQQPLEFIKTVNVSLYNFSMYCQCWSLGIWNLQISRWLIIFKHVLSLSNLTNSRKIFRSEIYDGMSIVYTWESICHCCFVILTHYYRYRDKQVIKWERLPYCRLPCVFLSLDTRKRHIGEFQTNRRFTGLFALCNYYGPQCDRLNNYRVCCLLIAFGLLIEANLVSIVHVNNIPTMQFSLKFLLTCPIKSYPSLVTTLHSDCAKSQI